MLVRLRNMLMHFTRAQESAMHSNSEAEPKKDFDRLEEILLLVNVQTERVVLLLIKYGLA